MSSNNGKKLGVAALAALVVSAMIGGGIFSLPQNMAQSAGLTAVLLAWIITGIGIFFLANTFRTLSDVRPDAAAGIYTYARLGFGRFAGFQMAWAYYLSNVFGNVGYAVLLMDAMNYFFPGTFTGGNNIYSIIGGSMESIISVEGAIQFPESFFSCMLIRFSVLTFMVPVSDKVPLPPSMQVRTPVDVFTDAIVAVLVAGVLK